MKLKNEIMLITYADSLGKNLKDLHTVLDKYYKEAVGGVHILPFFPSSADIGFAPMCYDKVDEAFGNYNDIEKIGKDYYFFCTRDSTNRLCGNVSWGNGLRAYGKNKKWT